MTLLDANILLYAYDPAATEHSVAASWLQNLFDGPDVIGISWPVIWAFLRISTNQRIRPNPKAPADAFLKAKSWLAQPGVVLVEPGPRHVDILEKLVIQGQAAGPRVSDAVLAALAIENGATLSSTDRDFSRFSGLRWVNPLA